MARSVSLLPLVAALLLLPSVAALPGSGGGDERVELGGLAVVDVAYRDFVGAERDARVVEAKADASRDDAAGEQVVHVALDCGRVSVDATCVPDDHFAGMHSAPAGQSLRAGTNGDWRSASVQGDLTDGERSVLVQAGTFQYFMLQFYYVEVYADGERVVGVFDAVPLPLP
jgi:hypothetical protein